MFSSHTGVAVTGDPAKAEEEDALRSYARRGARVGLITAVLTGVLLSFAIRGLVDNLHLRARGVAAIARVTSLSCHEESSRSVHTVRCGGAATFRTADGTDVTTSFSMPKSSLDFTDPDHPTMRVVYDPLAPSNVVFRSSAVGTFDIVFFSLLCAGLTLAVLRGITLGRRRRRWESRVRDQVGIGPRVTASVKAEPGSVTLEQAGGPGRFAMRVIRGQVLPSTRRSAQVTGDLSDGGIVVVEFEGRTIWPAGRLHRGWFRRALTGFNFQRGTTSVD